MKIQFPPFIQANVLVLGDIMLDRYWHGGTSRISPEAPVPVVRVNEIEERPGGAGNVALNIASLGSKVNLLGLTGHDEAAQALQTKLEECQVHCNFQKVETAPTITKLRIISRNQQLIRLDFEESFNDQTALAKLKQKFTDSIKNVGAIVLSDYAKGALFDSIDLIKIARENKIPVLVDPKGSDFSRYAGATLITPNLGEFEAVVGTCSSETELVEKGLALLKKHQWQALLVTRGEQGMTLIRPDLNPLHLSARAREVYDVTGAGDTVIGTLAAAIAAGDDIASATALANVAAGIVVGKLGTATVNAAELRRAIYGIDDTENGTVTESQLEVMVADSRAHNEVIVMTNGCFDILHPGHVAYLQGAKRLGDRLIVAVNDDASVKRLKGEERPINNVENRMNVLAGLGAVDWVVPFGEDTPARLIEKILPNILVKGGDYQVKDIAGAQAVIDNGGIVNVLDYEDGCSTTDVINRIKEQDKQPDQ
ncbi:MAG: bifunctional D-glycero-beta-D-manno-heptose-7-phosphate kinase/D-glycero-beta-D-manno-heptose 1-phosphate adenylyltransferase HldE [Pseudomonadales bacterium]|nr:bifunctional D-glycero-beta-D-manno-heptose-7-phosphate kinase/D-glycero-beta-D-manno-heptose 1-phosphate adenylyltransferase HldE [Pseudomonadales bacterium]